jgi:hypothetical protein
MRKLALLLGPAAARYLWNRRKRGRGGADLPAAAIEPNLDAPQEQTEAMERAADIPGGVRP